MSSMYEGLSLVELKKAAKEKGLKNVSVMRKQELLDKLISLEESQKEAKKKKQKKFIRKSQLSDSLIE